MITKTWIRSYCRERSKLIKEVLLPNRQGHFDAPEVPRLQAKLQQIKEIRAFLRKYPHEKVEPLRRMPNGVEVLKGILMIRDGWEAANSNTVRLP